MTDRLPDLGPRGEGWVFLQFVLLGALVLAGTAGPAWSGAARVVTTAVGGGLLVAGFVLALRGLLDLRANLTAFPRPRDGATLVDRGAYRLARHPIYGGIVLGSFGLALAAASPLALLVAGTITVFFDLKSRREERWLVETVEGYAAYAARRRRLIPWVY